MKPELTIMGLGNQTKGDSMEGHETEAHAAPQDDGLGSVYDAPDPADPISRAIEYCRDHEDDEAAVAVESAVVANIDVIAIRRGEVCVSCTSFGYRAGDCPIFNEMREHFVIDPAKVTCQFWSGERFVAHASAEEQVQVSPEAPAEAISEPVSEAVSEPISEPSSGPEIQAEMPQPTMLEQMLGIRPQPPTLAEAIERVGAKLIAVAARDSDDATVVLAEVPGTYQPYVTWHYGEQRGDLFWGHYFSNEENARRDFDKRVKDAS